VRHKSHRVVILYAGRLIEIGGRDELYYTPIHPDTGSLLSAVPVPNPVSPTWRTRRRDAASPALPADNGAGKRHRP